MVYYSKKIQNTVSQGQKGAGQGLGKMQARSSVSVSQQHCVDSVYLSQ